MNEHVNLKVPPWISKTFNHENIGWQTIKIQIGNTTTVESLLASIASNNNEFRKVVYNPETGYINELLIFFLNDSYLRQSQLKKTIIRNGDTILLLPIHGGG